MPPQGALIEHIVGDSSGHHFRICRERVEGDDPWWYYGNNTRGERALVIMTKVKGVDRWESRRSDGLIQYYVDCDTNEWGWLDSDGATPDYYFDRTAC